MVVRIVPLDGERFMPTPVRPVWFLDRFFDLVPIFLHVLMGSPHVVHWCICITRTSVFIVLFRCIFRNKKMSIILRRKNIYVYVLRLLVVLQRK